MAADESETPYTEVLLLPSEAERRGACSRRGAFSMVLGLALGLVLLATARSSRAPLADATDLTQLHQLLDGREWAAAMPLMALADAHTKPPPGRFDDLVPVVFLHGMGDSGSNPGMQSMCQTASDKYPGLYVVCANVANGLSSITKPLAEQVEEFADFVRSDQKLSDGFHAVGFSQGGLVLRGYVELHNEPPIKRFISVCAPHGGVGACPSSPIYNAVCPLWKLAPYTAPLAFADYWKDPTDQKTYLARSRWLAEMNNERNEKKEIYKQQMLKLERYVLVEATNDTTISPHASESHGTLPPSARADVRRAL